VSKTDQDLLTTVSSAALEAELARRAAGGPRRVKRPSQASDEIIQSGGPTIASSEDKAARSIEEFCRLHSISRSALYSQWALGTGPRFFKVGTLRRISPSGWRGLGQRA
jgi:hypothetical protein